MTTKENKKETKTMKQTTTTSKTAIKKTTTKKETTKKPVIEKETTRKTTSKKLTNTKPVINKNVKADTVEEKAIEKLPKIKIEDKKDSKKICPLKKLNKKLLAIIICAIVVVITIIALLITNSSKTYKLNEILSCYEGSNETITLDKKYLVSNDATIYLKNDKYIEAIGALACYSEDEEEFNALLSEIKEAYESFTEFESNSYQCFYFNYGYEDYSLDYVFMYKDNKILQLVFEGLDKNEVIEISKNVK